MHIGVKTISQPLGHRLTVGSITHFLFERTEEDEAIRQHRSYAGRCAQPLTPEAHKGGPLHIYQCPSVVYASPGGVLSMQYDVQLETNSDEHSKGHRVASQSFPEAGLEGSIWAPSRKRGDVVRKARPASIVLRASSPDKKKFPLGEALQRMVDDILSYIPALLHRHARIALGHNYIMQDPAGYLTEVKSLQALEGIIASHWSTFIYKLLPGRSEVIFKFNENAFSRNWENWYSWSTGSGALLPTAAVGPSDAELTAWIEAWDLFWKRLLLDEQDADRNMEIVSAWRRRARHCCLA